MSSNITVDLRDGRVPVVDLNDNTVKRVYSVDAREMIKVGAARLATPEEAASSVPLNVPTPASDAPAQETPTEE